MREAVSPRGRRGYEIQILESDDGHTFRKLISIERETVQMIGFERPALVIDPGTGNFRLYVCGPVEGEHLFWGILAFDPVNDISRVDRSSMHPVLPPVPPQSTGDLGQGYKDPILFHDGEQWHMYVIAYDRVERTGHFLSKDAETWEPDPANPVLDAGGWHNFYTRPACVFPGPVGYFFVYEGSAANWFDAAYNIATGLGYTFDLSQVIDLTPEAPLLRSTTAGDYHTWRYSCWVPEGDRIHVYAEVACPNNAN